jgi:L-threonylcarbamoyladenylate synthase
MVGEDELRRAADLIRAGRLVAFPTETVYGLGANALDAEAVDRIYAAKGRPPTSPLIIHVASVGMAQQLVSEWNAAADLLVRRFWPGPLTLVLPKRSHVSDRLTAGLATVGVRMPRHPVALALIEAAGVPIAAPSANRFTEISPTSADHVRESIGNAVDLVLDDGPTNVGIESTVLSLAGAKPVLLRPGMVTRAEIEETVGPVDTGSSVQGAHASPGMHHRHYSPKTRLAISDHPPSGRVAWIWWNHDRPSQRSVQMPRTAEAYAVSLYDTLHVLDKEGWDLIAVEPVPDSVDWDGIRDRLSRAAEHGEAGDRVI